LRRESQKLLEMEHIEIERSRIISELGEATIELSHLTARISILTEKLKEFDRLHLEYSQSATKNRTPATNYVETQLVR
jgi:tRNA1(Val) A37 N6-methylase TrmN6